MQNFYKVVIAVQCMMCSERVPVARTPGWETAVHAHDTQSPLSLLACGALTQEKGGPGDT